MGISESKYKAAETLDLRKLILDNSIELNDESAIDELIEKLGVLNMYYWAKPLMELMNTIPGV
jgi:hypothetical protein